MLTLPNIWAVVPAAGSGRRMVATIPKQYLPLAGQSVLQQTINKLFRLESLSGIYVALAPSDTLFEERVQPDSRLFRVSGGDERADSVFNALHQLMEQGEQEAWALVHDAARPCVRIDHMERLIRAALASECGGILASPVADTLKRVQGHSIQATVNRSELWQAHTPQMFPVKVLYEALQKAFAKNKTVTDEASAMELAGHTPIVVEDSRDNIKITRPEDLALAEFILQQQRTAT